MNLKDKIIKNVGITTAAIGYLVGTIGVVDSLYGSKDIRNTEVAFASYAICVGGAFVASRIIEKNKNKTK